MHVKKKHRFFLSLLHLLKNNSKRQKKSFEWCEDIQYLSLFFFKELPEDTFSYLQQKY